MADVNSKFDIGVTTGPIRGSRKIHVGPLNVAMRAIDLDPSCGEPPLNVNILVDDERIPLNGEEPEMRQVRFRTLGCYPLTGAVESSASTVEEIVHGPLPEPRDQVETKATVEFAQLRSHLFSLVKRRKAAAPA